MKKTTLKIKKVKLDEIKPYWRNPRNNDLAIAPTQKSIEDYGYNVPITVDAENVIVTGHTRYKALLNAGFTHIDVIDLSHLPPDKIKEFRIADNKVSEMSSWDQDKLIAELRETMADNMQVYFPSIDIEALLNDSAGGNTPNITAQELLDRAKELNDQYNQAGEQKMIELICPHCAKTYTVQKFELENAFKHAETPSGT